MLIGLTPLKALHSDPRISYSLYIPPTHYNPDPKRVVPSPESSGEGEDPPHPSYQRPLLPLLISIHGTHRDAASCRRRLIHFADTERCAVLAPLFPAGLDDELDLDSYKLLRSPSLRSDVALLDIVREVAVRYPGIKTEEFFLVGFSGGGQFVHRFLYLYPERVLAASIGAPGRVTHLDRAAKWPLGVADVGEIFGEALSASGGEVDLDAMRKINEVQMIVGGDDVSIPDEEFYEWVKKVMGKTPKSTTGSMEPMRCTRVETLRKLHEEWSSLGIKTMFTVVDGLKHDSNGLHPEVEKFLTPWLRHWWLSKDIADKPLDQ